MAYLRSLAVGALFATVAAANANAIVVTTFDSTGLASSQSEAAASAGVGAHGALAESFLTDSGSSITLNSVTLDLKLSAAATTGSFIVTLDAASGTPGTPVTGTPIANFGTFTDAGAGLSTSAITPFTITGLSTPLSANTEYFLVLTDANSTTHTKVGWSYSNGGTGTGTVGQIGLFSSSEPTQWNGTLPSPDVYLAQVTTTEAPEPATLAVLGVGLAGIGWARRRKA